MSNRAHHNETPAYATDAGPGRVRLGLIALANDEVIERDMTLLRPDDGVLMHTTRIPFDGECTLEDLRAMGPALGEAAALLNPGGRLDAIIYGCTSGTVALGEEKVRDLIGTGRPGMPVVNPLDAVRAALAALGAKSISVVTPYVPDVALPVVEALELAGIKVETRRDLGIVAPDLISKVTPRSIADAARAADTAAADAIFIACTDFRSLNAIARIETALGKPVVTSNQALFWKAMSDAGHAPVCAGFGRLLQPDGTSSRSPDNGGRPRW